MKVRVLMFAGAREAAGADAVEVELESGATYAQLAARLAEQHPKLASMLAVPRFAAGAQYVSLGEAVDPNAETALIPPVSGG